MPVKKRLARKGLTFDADWHILIGKLTRFAQEEFENVSEYKM